MSIDREREPDGPISIGHEGFGVDPITETLRSERDALVAQLSALRPVVEAARKLRRAFDVAFDVAFEDAPKEDVADNLNVWEAAEEVEAAVRAYESQLSKNPGELK